MWETCAFRVDAPHFNILTLFVVYLCNNSIVKRRPDTKGRHEMSINETITKRGHAILNDIAGTANGDMKVANEMLREICVGGDGADVACILAALIDLRANDPEVRKAVGGCINEAVLGVWNAADIWCASHSAK